MSRNFKSFLYINFYFLEWTEWIINFLLYFEVPVSIEVRVGDHGALQVKSPVPEVDQVVTVLHVGRGAAQDLSWTQRLRLNNIV